MEDNPYQYYFTFLCPKYGHDKWPPCGSDTKVCQCLTYDAKRAPLFLRILEQPFQVLFIDETKLGLIYGLCRSENWILE